MNKTLLALVVLFIVVILGCGGGGGGVAPTAITVQGNVLWIETGSAPSPQATVRIGDQSTLSDAIDGYFTIDTSAGNLQLTVTYSPTSGSPVVRTFDLGPVSADLDLRDIYIGPEEVTIAGQVLDSTSSAPVPGATVKMAGRTALTASDGRFTMPQVAYSSSTLSVFLGLQGSVEKTGYFSTFFSPPGAPSGGTLNVGSISLTPTGSIVPPPLPFNVSGSFASGGAGASVQVLSGASVIRTVTADGLGQFKLWLPTGTYTVNATLGALSGSNTLTVSNVNSLTSVQITLN
ncbi:MAG: hypothetical protein ACKVQS_01705 [Fimbriimonadaceae bacterium]